MPSKPRNSKKKRIVFVFLIILIFVYLGYNVSVDIKRTNFSIRDFSNKSISSLIASLVMADHSSPLLLNQIRSSSAVVSANQNVISDTIVLKSQISSEITAISEAINENPGIQQLRALYNIYATRMIATDNLLRCFYGFISASGSSDSGNCFTTSANSYNTADQAYKSLLTFEKKYGFFVNSVWTLGNNQWTASSVLGWATTLSTELQLNGSYSLDIAAWTVSPAPVRFDSNGLDVLPPATIVSVSFAIANNGSYIEQNIPISVTVKETSTGIQTIKRSEISLLPMQVPSYGNYQNISDSKYLTLGPFPVSYGQTYTIYLQVGPVGNQPNTGVSKSVNIQVAPDATTTT